MLTGEILFLSIMDQMRIQRKHGGKLKPANCVLGYDAGSHPHPDLQFCFDRTHGRQTRIDCTRKINTMDVRQCPALWPSSRLIITQSMQTSGMSNPADQGK